MMRDRYSRKVKRMRRYVLVVLATLFGGTVSAQLIPPAIFSDPPVDAEHPARMTALRVPTHGVQVNGIIYQAAGAGPHPTLVICHRLPGNEKHLDKVLRETKNFPGFPTSRDS